MSNAKIVITDDEKIVTSAFKTLLRVEGYNDVNCFNNPLDAVEFLKNNQPDIIISDFLMPEMNGLEFLRKAKELYPEVSMILLTGYADKENAIKAINEIGLYKYIEKPWDNDDLLFNIRNGIERSHLLSDLRDKIKQLEEAKKQLELYSNNLEKLVAERTADLTLANSKLSGIINYCADGIIIIDSEGNIEQANPACENMTGLSESALLKKKFQEIAYLNNYTPHQEKGNGIILGLDNDSSEVLIKDCYIINSLGGMQTPVEINFASLAVDDKNKFVGVIRDVSKHKETERLRDDFIATLTHDLRTPLLAAIQTLKFFLDGSLGAVDEKQKVLLSTMLKSNEDLLGLVNALLEVYRFESGKLELCKTIFPIKDLVTQCYEELKPLAENKNINFVLNADEIADKTEIYADKAEIKRVIINLCGNAVNYTNKDGEIEILAKVQSGDFIFSVSDNGNGIPKEDIPNLFNRFSQGTSRKRSTGTGLGLYLSRQIVEAHGGKIWLESKLNKGSEFTFLLTNVVKEERQVVNG
ncbi:response regulator [Spirochaetes bacterium]|uniref:histidine kinase n=1 Tax=Candidatus Scatousia excrementipullorum TaxID=2840936 RepID=A0A9D9DPX9_9BACT|nr:response regulator [Candidatus Scatousia excrementipullorum]